MHIKSLKTHDELMHEIDKINDDFNKYVLKTEFKEFKDKMEIKLDNVDSKLDDLKNDNRNLFENLTNKIMEFMERK